MAQDTNSRRHFLRSITAGMAGGVLLNGTASPAGQKDPAEKRNTQIPDKTSERFWKTVKKRFKFENGVRYFNNASLGSSPEQVRRETYRFRNMLDSFPSKYMWGGWQKEKEATRQKVAGLFSVDKEEIALIHNTTEGMNLIARSFDLQPGDEVILADHEHPSGRICWEVFQETRGVRLIRPELPILPEKTEELVDVYRKAITPRTKVISMCHIVNTNGMMLPVREVSEMAHKKGIPVAVDGAQSAGMYQIDLNELGCDFYAASSHKWLFSPKGVGVLYARKDSQHLLKPLIVASGHRDKSIRRLENYNTRNLPEVLGLGAAVDFHNGIGSKAIHERTFELKHYFRAKIRKNPKLRLKTPGSDDLSGAIQVVEVVGRKVREVKKHLFEKFGIDCRPMDSYGLNALRFSFAIYITKKDIDHLVKALDSID